MLIPSYKPLWVTLVKHDKKKVDLVRDLKLSSSTVAKMNKGEYVALKVIGQLCEYLNVRIEEVVEFVEDDQLQ